MPFPLSLYYLVRLVVSEEDCTQIDEDGDVHVTNGTLAIQLGRHLIGEIIPNVYLFYKTDSSSMTVALYSVDFDPEQDDDPDEYVISMDTTLSIESHENVRME